MKITPTDLPGIVVVEPKVFADDRGYFFESFHGEHFAAAGIASLFVQDNVSRSAKGVLRGLHLQEPFGQGKLVSVLFGEVFDVAVDVRVGSPHFGQWTGVYLSEHNKKMLWIPPGFAHGFIVTSGEAIFSYKCTEYYHPEAELAVLWNDSAIGIQWPIDDPALSVKDGAARPLAELKDVLPRFRA
jgi:dTDP-4-dehydrorhamnose 3,5-epimerase